MDISGITDLCRGMRLIRSEYEKLRNYCRENLYTYEGYRDKERTEIV